MRRRVRSSRLGRSSRFSRLIHVDLRIRVPRLSRARHDQPTRETRALSRNLVRLYCRQIAWEIPMTSKKNSVLGVTEASRATRARMRHGGHAVLQRNSLSVTFDPLRLPSCVFIVRYMAMQDQQDLASCFLPPFVSDDCLESWTLIGSGGFGKIYKAKHKEWQMDIAIKLLHSNDGSNSSLLQEADLMRHGGNPNVLRILGVYKSQDQKDKSAFHMGLVMEYMERGSLVDLQLALKECPPWPLAFRIINQIALGMNFLHQLKPPLLHLDLKPSNVLLDDSLNAKLTDFGLAKITKSTSKLIDEKAGDAAGTTSYMPPEAFYSSDYVPHFSSDVYSYSILVWSVITGKQPYISNSSLVRFRVYEGDRPDLKSLENSQVDGLSSLIDLVKKCWDHNPKIRPTFRDCTEITNNLYEKHKQNVPDAVHTVLKQLDNKDKLSSSLASLSINTQTNNGMKNQTDVKTSTEEMGSTPSASGAGLFSHSGSPKLAGMYYKPARAPTAHLRPNTQRQSSTPSNASICLSDVTGVQIGNNNYMNIQGSKQRRRHPTAPSVTQQPPKHQQKPPNDKP